MLELNNLSVSFYNHPNEIKAVRDISFGISKQEIVALVGESGCGKTVSALSITKLIPENIARVTGQVMFKGEDLLNFDKEKIRKIRGGVISYVFQQPSTSLNPVNTIGSQIVEAIMLHQSKAKKEAYDLAFSLLNEVGISNAKERFNSYPHQFSGGMNQRAMIAMALSSDPELLIADEPTTALDVTIQAQILRLLLELKKQRALTILFITHDLNIVSRFADKIIVMYAGKIVEILNRDVILSQNNHPYTLGLLGCIPKDNKATGRLNVIKGEIPSVSNLPSGCVFHPRCPEAIAKCKEIEPALKELTPVHRTACHLR